MSGEREQRVTWQPHRLRQVRPRDMAIRFAFGCVVSAVAAVISATVGPGPGGVFMAFPAILLASLTLVAQEEGLKTARSDVGGAALGAIGFIAFAVVYTVLAGVTSGWLALAVAAVVWVVVSLTAYFVPRLLVEQRGK